jgi:hypothetical protein
MSEQGERPNFVNFGRVESPAGDKENKVIYKDAESNKDDRENRKFRLQEVEGTGSCCGSPGGDPSNPDEPVDPFYEFLAEKQLLFY